MFSFAFRATWKNFRKHPLLFALNLLGLGSGLAGALFLWQYVRQESSYDQFHPDAAQIYRLPMQIEEPGGGYRWAVSPIPLGAELKADYPDVAVAARLLIPDRSLLVFENQRIYEDKIYFATADLLKILDLNLDVNAPEKLLDGPNKLVISATLANQLFGKNDPIGKIVRYDQERDLEVTGVYPDVPANSHFRPTGIISESGIADEQAENWSAFSCYTYVKMKPGAVQAALESHLKEITDKFINPMFEGYGTKVTLFAQPVTDIHLDRSYEREFATATDKGSLRVFGLVAWLLIGVAGINFLLLTLAKSLTRIKEVAVRKTSGASPGNILAQYLLETLALTFIATAFGIGLLFLLLPLLNGWFGAEVQVAQIFGTVSGWGFLLASMVLLSIIGSAYPAFFLSRLQPAAVLKGARVKIGSTLLRQALVTLQLAVSFLMISCTWVIHQQMNHLKTSDLGFRHEQTVVVELSEPQVRARFPVWKAALKSNKDIIGIASSDATPGKPLTKTTMMPFETDDHQVKEQSSSYYQIDFDFLSMLQFQLSQGRFFSSEMGTDSFASALVNEAMVRLIGWKEPVGKQIFIENKVGPSYQIIGVVKDFHQLGFYDAYEPVVILPGVNRRFVHIQLVKGAEASAIEHIRKTWEATFPELPLVYNFLDDNFQEQYAQDQIRERIFVAFTTLALLIGLMGLLGLAAYVLAQRQKEMAVRKVLGAETQGLWWLLSRNYLVMAVVAALMGAPLGIWYLNQWLETFEFHMELSIWPFIASWIVTLAVVLLVTSYQTLKTARANPALALRNE